MDRNSQQSVPADATEADARREFIKKIGKASAAAPAVALLMAANYKDAKATPAPSGSGSS